MAWNLVDELSYPAPSRRKFYVPLASIPVGRNNVRQIDRTMYTFDESYSTLPPPDGRTSDICLNVRIQIPANGLLDEDGLPDPLIRLHALGQAKIGFATAGGGMQDRLILTLLDFMTSSGGLRLPNWVPKWPKWFKRWEDANSIPRIIIYENIDRNQLQNLLNGIIAPQDNNIENQVEPTNGLSFPVNVTVANRAAFIGRFLAGAADHFIFAKAGAVVGTADIDPGNGARRLLKLHAQYHDHADDNPRPMNPRELLYLIFGNDSDESGNHPVLVKMNEFGQNNQGNIHPESKRMLLRPPLRTWKRIEWEANIEINSHQNNWSPAGMLGANRFYNDHSRQVGQVVRTFNNGGYHRFNKCNLFTSDICIRSGFSACVHPVGVNRWHFIGANPSANLVHRARGAADRVAIQGNGDDVNRTWAWKIENGIRAQAVANRQQFLNNAMQVEGRCFLLAGARPRRFRPHRINVQPPPPPPAPAVVAGIADCAASLRRTGIGHVLIVREVLAQPQLAAVVEHGLTSIRIRTWEASGAGAVSRNYNAQLGGGAAAAAGAVGFIRLHIFELQPGQDPDTIQGLRSLNVQTPHPGLLGTPNERAANRRITHTPNGANVAPPPAPQNCCHDNHPPAGAAPNQVPC